MLKDNAFSWKPTWSFLSCLVLNGLCPFCLHLLFCPWSSLDLCAVYNRPFQPGISNSRNDLPSVPVCDYAPKCFETSL